MKHVEKITARFAHQRKGQEMYASFLKRKRLERGMKLEDVATGICSVSYLSRIENSLVVASDDNMKALFERLDLNYDSVKKIREKNIYEELLMKELSGDKEEIVTIINDAINNKAYTTVELDLLILYNSILNKIYEEAKTILIKQEALLESYCNNELIFYIYLFARYLYETNQNKRAYSQIKILCSIEQDSEFMKAIIYDLAINILFMMGKETQMVNYYYILSKNESSYLFGKRLNLHQMKILVFNACFNNQNAIDQMNNLSLMIDINDEKAYNEYQYYLSLLYCRQGIYEKAIDILSSMNDSARSLALYGYLISKYALGKEISLFINKVKAFQFTKYDKLYNNFCNYYLLKAEGESSFHLYNYLRVNVLNDNILFYDSVLHSNAISELLIVGVSSSKYKETLRYLSENWHI